MRTEPRVPVFISWSATVTLLATCRLSPTILYFRGDVHRVGSSVMLADLSIYLHTRTDHSTDHEWKHGFFLHCLTPVIVTTISAQPQPYSSILDVDKKIRDFHIPPTLNIFNSEGITDIRQLTMQQVLVASGREIGEFLSERLCACALKLDTHKSYCSFIGIFLLRH